MFHLHHNELLRLEGYVTTAEIDLLRDSNECVYIYIYQERERDIYIYTGKLYIARIGLIGSL